MPIIIQEIVIKAVVDDANGSSGAETQSSADTASSKNEIIKACVEEVMRIINEKKER